MTALEQTVSDNASGEPSPGEPSAVGRDALGDEGTTADRLLTGLAVRLRVAYQQGAGLAELAVACRRTEAEVVRLLELAETEAALARPVGRRAGSDEHDRRQLRQTRRPTPSRRLSRLHPEARSSEAAIGAVAEAAVELPPAQLGILISASPSYTEPPAPAGSSLPRRVPAQLVRVSRGTSLVVLPSWRAAIAVSVPTDLLLSETGLSPEELADAELTVLMNPDALHDRELELRDWQARAAR